MGEFSNYGRKKDRTATKAIGLLAVLEFTTVGRTGDQSCSASPENFFSRERAVYFRSGLDDILKTR